MAQLSGRSTRMSGVMLRHCLHRLKVKIGYLRKGFIVDAMPFGASEEVQKMYMDVDTKRDIGANCRAGHSYRVPLNTEVFGMGGLGVAAVAVQYMPDQPS